MNYSEWFSQYLSLYKRKISDKTRESYLRLAQLVAPIIGAKPLEAITPDDIQAALVAVEVQAGSRQAQLAFTLMHAVFRRAVRSKHLRENPVEAVDKPDHEGKQGRAIEGANWQRLAPIISGDVAFALMAFGAGKPSRSGALMSISARGCCMSAVSVSVLAASSSPRRRSPQRAFATCQYRRSLSRSCAKPFVFSCQTP